MVMLRKAGQDVGRLSMKTAPAPIDHPILVIVSVSNLSSRVAVLANIM